MGKLMFSLVSVRMLEALCVVGHVLQQFIFFLLLLCFQKTTYKIRLRKSYVREIEHVITTRCYFYIF